MGHTPSRRPLVRLLFAALVATASCVSVFGLEEENYGPLEEELCNFAVEICSAEEFSLSTCLGGETFFIDSYEVDKLEACFEETDCQAFLFCVNAGSEQACDGACAHLGEPCNDPNCPRPCCDGECNGTFCCMPDEMPCNGDQECCSGSCIGYTCGGCLGALAECDPSATVSCCPNLQLQCIETSVLPTVCTRTCTGDSDCSDIPDGCCDVQTKQCRSASECCSFAEHGSTCLTDALEACTSQVSACCSTEECPEKVKYIFGCPDEGCVTTAPTSFESDELMACVCENDSGSCGHFCASGGGSGGSGGSGGMGGSGG